MRQAICFDFGGVLLHSAPTADLQAWETRLGIPTGQTERVLYGGPIGIQVQRGDISDDDVWAMAAQRFDLCAKEAAAFRAALTGSFLLDRELTDWLYRLRPHYQVALISNAPDGLRKALQTVFPIASAFDLIVCSAEERLLKPDPEIYHRALARLGCTPEAAVLIDDRPENIASAQAIGMQGILFRNRAELFRTWAEQDLRIGPTLVEYMALSGI